jgi:hypothetical protein
VKKLHFWKETTINHSKIVLSASSIHEQQWSFFFKWDKNSLTQRSHYQKMAV